MAKKKNVISSDEIDFSAMIIPDADDIRRTVSKGGVLTVVFAKDSVRLTFSKKFLEVLGYPEGLQLAFQKKKIYAGVDEELGGKYYHLNYANKNCESKASIYNTKLVKQIQEQYNLEFGRKVSLTFSKVKYIEKDEEIQGALIKMKQPEE